MTRVNFGFGALFALVLIAACGDGAPRLERDTLRIVCGIRDVEVDYFAEDAPETPLRRQMAANEPQASASEVGSPPQPFVGYPETFSVARGTPVRIRYAGELLPVGENVASIEVFDAHTHQSRARREFVGGQHPIRREVCESWFGGCNFARAIDLPTRDLPSGLYYVFLTDDEGAQTTPIYFHVRPTEAEVAGADVVVLLSETTWYAYNSYGGGSLYGIHRADEAGDVRIAQNRASRLYVASMRRPLLSDPSRQRPAFGSRSAVEAYFSDADHANAGAMRFQGYNDTSWMRVSPESNLVFSRLLRREGLSTVTVAMVDLEANSALLRDAKLLLISGHNEYWTTSMISSVESYVEGGGRIANFSGNVMWWQINIVDDAIYQDQLGHERSDRCKELLPASFGDTGYRHLLVESGPESLFGVNYRFANFPLDHANDVSDADLVDTYGVNRRDIDLSRTQGIVIADPAHPIFAGLNLRRGERFGLDVPLLAVELDGVPLTPSGEMDRSFPNDFPDNLQILASGSAFVATIEHSADRRFSFGGPKEVGLVVDVVPASNPLARTLSFGTIGYYNPLAAEDERFERLLLNTIGYLRETQEAGAGRQKGAP
ncbi:hypothetical protein U91I_01571 [alpha proteobacterium U9-1i]|nr:hypothetical protein U91I_01571 [alpha proteobacterium U9-1i]